MNSPHRHARTWRVVLFAAVTAAAVAATFALPRLPQDPAYHAFADRRTFARLPNAADVLSNLAFLAVGFLGLRVLRTRRAGFLDARERAPWFVLFAGVILTAAGSAIYHLAPTSSSLVLDRLPMSVAFMGLFSAMVAERLDVRAGTRFLVPLLAVGTVSVLWWYATELRGSGDLRPYYLVQAYTLAAIPLLLVIAPARYTGSGWLVAGLALYAFAKLTEARDGAIFAATRGVVSGHTLKHLLAASAIGAVVVMLAQRRPRAGERLGR